MEWAVEEHSEIMRPLRELSTKYCRDCIMPTSSLWVVLTYLWRCRGAEWMCCILGVTRTQPLILLCLLLGTVEVGRDSVIYGVKDRLYGA